MCFESHIGLMPLTSLCVQNDMSRGNDKISSRPASKTCRARRQHPSFSQRRRTVPDATRGLAFTARETLCSARSQGGVKFPTGGIRCRPGARERFRESERSADPVRGRSRRYSPDEREQRACALPSEGVRHACSPKGRWVRIRGTFDKKPVRWRNP
jgi:hypothetical protein